MVTLTGLTFAPSDDEVIYVSKGQKHTDEFISDNLCLIKSCFAKFNLRFIYLPLLLNEVQADINAIRYVAPAGTRIPVDSVPQLQNDYLLQFLGDSNLAAEFEIKPHILRYCSRGVRNEYVFGYQDFSVSGIDELEPYFSRLAFAYTAVLPNVMHSSIGETIPFTSADAAFDAETSQIMSEVKKQINLLRRRGISELVIRELVKPDIPLSKLRVTKDYHIFLTDYDNREVKMTPLVKSVYFLFLRHPEGINFKSLVDYREELAQIYYCVKNGLPMRQMLGQREYNQSILDLTDSTKNSINEKCTRIKEAFLLAVVEDVAKHYYVTGTYGKPKKILLPSDLIIWE